MEHIVTGQGHLYDPHRRRLRHTYFDTATALYKMGERYYDPSFGRWTQEDGLSDAGADLRSFNLYTYGNDDPVNNTDVNGTCVFCWWNSVRSWAKKHRTLANIATIALTIGLRAGGGALGMALCGPACAVAGAYLGAGLGTAIRYDLMARQHSAAGYAGAFIVGGLAGAVRQGMIIRYPDTSIPYWLRKLE